MPATMHVEPYLVFAGRSEGRPIFQSVALSHGSQ